MSREFYELTVDDRGRDVEVAREVPDVDYQPFSYRLKFEGGEVQEWPDLRYVLPRGRFADFLKTVNGMAVFSERLREVLDAHAGPADRFQWIPAWVRLQEQERAYWVLHFPSPPDVLHRDASTWGPGGVIRWVLDPARLQGHEVLRAKDVTSMNHVVVSETVLAALKHAGVTDGSCGSPCKCGGLRQRVPGAHRGDTTPHGRRPAWQELHGIDWVADLDASRSWFSGIVTGDPPPREVTGLWFGINEPVRAGGTVCDFYLSGSTEPLEEEWPAEVSWFPRGDYVLSPALAQVYRAGRREDLHRDPSVTWLLDYAVPLALVASTVVHLLREVPAESWLGGADRRHVALGHDSGAINDATVTADAIDLPPLTIG